MRCADCDVGAIDSTSSAINAIKDNDVGAISLPTNGVPLKADLIEWFGSRREFDWKRPTRILKS